MSNISPELKRLHSPDIADLPSHVPATPEDFAFLLQAMIGPFGLEGEESFDFFVCTPTWLQRHHEDKDVIFGQYYIIVFEYDYQALVDKIAELCRVCVGRSWKESATKLARFGKWEFEGYRISGT
jgi:Immunity protein 8